MANLRTCSRCKSTIDELYFSVNRKKEYYKTCNTCRTKYKQILNSGLVCDNPDEAITSLKSFFYKYKYPEYDVVPSLIKDDSDLVSEYKEFNHNLLNKLWDDITNEQKNTIICNLIKTREGFVGLINNLTIIFMRVLRYVLKKFEVENRDTIFINTYKLISAKSELWNI